jgi:Undecaprenyl-phosphate glucose phosphotransferase
MSNIGSEAIAGYAVDASPHLGQMSGMGLRPVSTRVIRDLVRLVDMALLIGAAVVGWLPIMSGTSASGPFLLAGVAGTLVAVVVFSHRGIYSLAYLLGPHRGRVATVGGVVLGASVGTIVLVLTGVPLSMAAQWAGMWAVCGGVALLLLRMATLSILRRYQAQGRLARKLAIVGVNNLSAALIERVDMTAPNTAVVGLYVERDEEAPQSQCGVAVLGGLDDLIVHTRVQAIDTIVVAVPLVERARLERICDRLRDVACDVYLTADVVGLHYRASALAEIDGHPVIVVRQRPLKDWQGVQKRAFDLLFGWLFLALAAPAMAAIALAIRFDSPGPVLFRQRRLGFNNNVITVFKFRTMHHQLSDPLANRLTERNDPRVTRLGRILRKLSLDELPQIFNVLSGDMSLVGPRPHALNAKAANRYYGDVVAEYARRHVVKPGITGWAQVSGWRGETRTEEQIRQRVAHDLHYIENWSLGFDLKILWLTFVREVFSRHAF